MPAFCVLHNFEFNLDLRQDKCLAVGIPPAKETFFQVAMRTCFGWNVSVPTIASLQIENV